MIDPQLFSRNLHVLHKSISLDLRDFLFWNLSYSLYGEDLLLRGMFKDKLRTGSPGFYIDLGCALPGYGSNTMLFYRYGWRGLCVDANPSSVDKFAALRPRDTCLHCAVGDGSDAYWAAHKSNFGMSRIDTAPENFNDDFSAPVKVKTVPLSDLIERHVPKGVPIDFMSLDLEGSELVALQSNNWSRFRPRIIIAEIRGIDVMSLKDSSVAKFLAEQGYRAIAYACESAMFVAT